MSWITGSTHVAHSDGSVAPRALLADDDHELRRLLADELFGAGFTVDQCANGAQLLRRLVMPGARDYQLVVTDLRMPGLTGLEILELLRALDRRTPLILMTGFGDDQTRIAAGHLGADAFFDKPFDLAQLRRAAVALGARDA